MHGGTKTARFFIAKTPHRQDPAVRKRFITGNFGVMADQFVSLCIDEKAVSKVAEELWRD